MMRRRTMQIGSVALLALAGVVFAQNAKVVDQINGLVWAKPAEGRAVIEKLLTQGKPAVRELCTMLKSPEEKVDDTKVRFALEGVVMTVMQDTRNARRKLVSGVFIEEMGKAAKPEVKAYLIRQLARIGEDEAVPALAPLLAEKRFCEPAAQALLHIGTPPAAAALAKALPTAKGGDRVTVIRALGQLRHAPSAQAILPLAKDAHVQTRLAAWYALANCGVTAADEALKAGSADKDAFVRSRALRARLLLAQRTKSEAIARQLLATKVTPATRQVVCGALAALVDLKGAQATPDLVQAVQSPDWQVREAALKLAQELSEARIACGKLVETEPKPEIRAAVVAMLGRSRDPQGKLWVLNSLNDKEALVRNAGAQASVGFAADGMNALVAYAAQSPAASDAAAAKGALLQVREKELTVKLGAVLPKATPAGKQTILDVLAARNAADQSTVVLAELAGTDRNVTKGALKALETIARARDEAAVIEFFSTTKSSSARSGARSVLVALSRRDAKAVTPILAAQAKAEGKLRSEFLGVLANIGGTPALAAVQADMKSPDADLRNAAVRALAQWTDVAAAPALLAIIQKPESEVHRVLALRGYVALTGKAGGQAVPMLKTAGGLAKTANDKKLVLGGLGNVRSEAALLAVAPYLDDAEVREEAAAAAVKIACPQNSRDKGLVSTKVAVVLNKVVAVSKNAGVVAKANAHLPNLPIAVDGVNIAIGKPVTTSCEQQGDKAPWKAVDGKLGNLDAWFGAEWPSWFQIDLKKAVTINASRIIFYNDGRRYFQYTIDASLDGKAWTVVADNTKNTKPATKAGLTHKFAKPLKARYVRLSIKKNSVNEAVHVVEVEVYSDDPAAEKLSARQINDPNNVAIGRPATAFPKHERNLVPPGAVNGKLNNGDGWWGDPSPKAPAWFQVDLGAATSIDTVRAVCYSDGSRFYAYRVEGSADAKTWTLLADHSKNKAPSTAIGYIHRFKPATVRYVRLFDIKNSSNPSVHLNELEVYLAGKAPKDFGTAAPAPKRPASLPKAPPLAAPDKDGFISLFNGKDLGGWMGSTGGYAVEDGVLVCKKKGGGQLMTMHRFSDFVLRFQFKIPEGANNGLAIRSPAKGNPAYAGMELQIIDNKGYEKINKYKLKPWQTHGSIYGCVPAKVGALKPCGEWNVQEVRAVGSQITVVLNGTTIVDADLDALTETADGKGVKGHPGLQRRTGHIGWLGHGARVEFKDIKVKQLEPYTAGPHNVPPKGFTALFNGKDFTNWKGLLLGKLDSPERRLQLKPDELTKHQAAADKHMTDHWRIEDGMFIFDGKGRSLATAKDYGDFEMYVDWKIKKMGDSGIYLRGSPQVQIWDPAKWPVGSGGLFNNQKNPRNPTECADNRIEQWNRMFIRMVGEKVTVVLNGVKVVDNVVLENYWNRKKPIYATGQIELQNHGNTLWFRNIYIRELPRQEQVAR